MYEIFVKMMFSIFYQVSGVNWHPPVALEDITQKQNLRECWYIILGDKNSSIQVSDFGIRPCFFTNLSSSSRIHKNPPWSPILSILHMSGVMN